MLTIEDLEKQSSAISLTDRQEFLKLPRDERRRILEIQAEQMLQHYEQDCESADRETWQGGDIIEFWPHSSPRRDMAGQS